MVVGAVRFCEQVIERWDGRKGQSHHFGKEHQGETERQSYLTREKHGMQDIYVCCYFFSLILISRIFFFFQVRAKLTSASNKRVLSPEKARKETQGVGWRGEKLEQGKDWIGWDSPKMGHFLCPEGMGLGLKESSKFGQSTRAHPSYFWVEKTEILITAENLAWAELMEGREWEKKLFRTILDTLSCGTFWGYP